MAKTKSGRIITTVELTEAAIERIDAYLKQRGVPKKHALSKLVEWFAAAPDSLKSAIMGWVDAGNERAVAFELRRLADELDAQFNVSALKSAPPDPPPEDQEAAQRGRAGGRRRRAS